MSPKEIKTEIEKARTNCNPYGTIDFWYRDALEWVSDMPDSFELERHMFPEEQPPFNRVILFKFKDNYFELVNYTKHTTFSVDPINWWESPNR